VAPTTNAADVKHRDAARGAVEMIDDLVELVART
jgi:hypothetical protein